MELTELQALIPNYEELQKQIIALKPASSLADYKKQYDPKQHDITDTTKRPDKLVTTDEGSSTVPVARLPIAMQKKIVGRAATFLCGNPIKLAANPSTPDQEALISVIQKTWDDNKLDYESKVLAKLMMSELEVAELWYTEPADATYWIGTPNEGAQFRLRMKMLANKYGDTLYPVFNNAGDMIAFGRAYSLKEGDKTVDHFDLYTDVTIYLGSKTDAGWQVASQANAIGKIPVIYYSQELPEWSDVQELIDRLEKSFSNLADTVDYFGSPMIKVKGEVVGFAKKGEQGKVLEMKENADADYLAWDQSPESVKLEQMNLISMIHNLTDTPDISFEQLKGMGAFSGIALKMLFMGAHMKAAEHEEVFGKSVQRRVNFLKAALAKINVKLEPALALSIKPVFEYFLPKNEQEKVDMLMTATGNKPILSRKTAVALNPFVEDPEKELANIQEEAQSPDALDDQFA